MIFLKHVFLAMTGLSAGICVSGGVFTALIAVGLVPRFAGKTHTGHKVFLYEEMVIFGTNFGNLLSLFPNFFAGKDKFLQWNLMGSYTELFWNGAGNIFLLVYGIFAGMFVGCLALAIAEMLNSIPILARRIGFRHGLGIAIFSMALGKLVGSLLYFIREIFYYGGL